jgi:hypothetical protein
MTLSQALVGHRSQCSEHGQSPVALPPVRNRHDLCVLLPLDPDGPEIKVPADQGIVPIVHSMTTPPSSAIALKCVGIEEAVLLTTPADLPDDMSSDDNLAVPTGLDMEA